METDKESLAVRQRKEALELQSLLAEKGIFAIYGDGSMSKGHGFWLYPISPEVLAWSKETGELLYRNLGPCIRNDGKKSGNPYFTMFEDAKKFV